MSLPPNSSTPRIMYFGCWGESGHFMWTKGKGQPHDSDLLAWGYPLPAELDANRILLPYPEKVGYGCRTYLPSIHVTLLSWWNQTFDERPQVNSHIIMKGRANTELLWDAFCHHFPDLSKLHIKPIIAEQY